MSLPRSTRKLKSPSLSDHGVMLKKEDRIRNFIPHSLFDQGELQGSSLFVSGQTGKRLKPQLQAYTLTCACGECVAFF